MREAECFGFWKLVCGLKLWYMYDMQCEDRNENKVLVVQQQPLEVSSVVKERRNKNCEPVSYKDQPPSLTLSASFCSRQTFSSLVPTQTAIHDTKESI